jgi:hypothetical protein
MPVKTTTKQVRKELEGIKNGLPNKARHITDPTLIDIAQKHYNVQIAALTTAVEILKRVEYFGGIETLMQLAEKGAKQDSLFDDTPVKTPA